MDTIVLSQNNKWNWRSPTISKKKNQIGVKMLQWYQIVRHWWISNFFKRNHISKERNIQYFLFLCSGSSPVPSSKAKTDRQNCSIIQYCFCLQSISYSKNIFLKAAIFLRIILLRIAYQHGRPFNSKTLYKSIGLI